MSRIDLSDATAAAAMSGVLLDDGADPVTAYARSVWSALAEPGDGAAGALVRAHGPVRALEIAQGSDDPTGVLDGGRLAEARARWQPRLGEAASPAQAARRAGVRLLTPEHPDWPLAVDDLGDHAPLCLWLRGEVDLLKATRTRVAVVGARAATAYGEHVAAELAADLSDMGVDIVSGAAYGIDGAAHRATLRAGGRTVALLAGGVDRAYPAGHRDLLDRITCDGLLLSEVPCGATPTKWRFLSRNRIIAAISDATVVVEAGWRSGSLNTAHHAATLGRPLGAVPGPVTSAASAGCHRLLREADAVCITGAKDVRELLGADEPALFDVGPYTDDAVRVLDALNTRGPRSAADVAARAGMSPEDAASLLGLMALEGRVVQSERGWRRAGAS
jgi:DNA processing protein